MTISRRSDHLQVWHDFALGKRPEMDWKWLFKDYVACVDFPVCMFYGELMEIFPDAKVILTVRDPQSWWKSFNSKLVDEFQSADEYNGQSTLAAFLWVKPS